MKTIKGKKKYRWKKYRTLPRIEFHVCTYTHTHDTVTVGRSRSLHTTTYSMSMCVLFQCIYNGWKRRGYILYGIIKYCVQTCIHIRYHNRWRGVFTSCLTYRRCGILIFGSDTTARPRPGVDDSTTEPVWYTCVVVTARNRAHTQTRTNARFCSKIRMGRKKWKVSEKVKRLQTRKNAQDDNKFWLKCVLPYTKYYAWLYTRFQKYNECSINNQ